MKKTKTTASTQEANI